MKSGNRRRASYELVVRWDNDVWMQVAQEENIIQGFGQNGYIDFNDDLQNLHSKLRETIVERGVPHEVIHEMENRLRELQQLDDDETSEVEELDDETSEVEELDDETSEVKELDDETSEVIELDDETSEVEELDDKTSEVEELDDQTSEVEELDDETSEVEEV